MFGHSLKYVQNASNETDYGSYGILSRTDSGEVLVALLPISEVVGVFSGELREPGESVETVRDAQHRIALEEEGEGM